jgi:hypothetical protein
MKQVLNMSLYRQQFKQAPMYPICAEPPWLNFTMLLTTSLLAC